MTEKQASEKGYKFTGDYERSKEEINNIAKEYKEKGYKVIVCTVPDSPLTRGIRGTGYSIYAEPKYFIDKEITELNRRLSYVESNKQKALDEYNKKIAEIEEDKNKMQDRLVKLNNK